MGSPFASGRFTFLRPVAALAGIAATIALTSPAEAVNNEPAVCLSPDPSQWPAPSKPYFMIAFDTSSAMQNAVAGAAPPCAGFPSTNNGHTRCAVQNAVQAFSGQVNFGLTAMALNMSGCTSTCFNSCAWTAWSGDPNPCAPGPSCLPPNFYGCGPIVNGVRHSGQILVPMLWDHFWQTTPATCTLDSQCPTGICQGNACQQTNVSSILKWMDNDCTGNQELWVQGKAPQTGVLNDLYDYFSGTYIDRGNNQTLPSPLDTGTPSQERSCRSVNIIMFASGDENCDGVAAAKAAAAKLYAGVTVGGITYNVRTHLIAWPGGANTTQIAGTGASSTQQGSDGGHGYLAQPNSFATVSLALANIIGSAIQPETCDNADNNCNGCTDEGFNHYCNIRQGNVGCCTQARATCLANYQGSITSANPQGDLTLLPCEDANQGSTPSTWLCYDPKETCDNVDNNCNGQTDEGFNKCGSPLHCPQTETCNNQDDDCDGVIDNTPSGPPYSVCPGTCHPTPEICDGCDNDCDGIVDNGVPNAKCGLPAGPQTPSYCTGTLQCTQQGTAVPPGTCVSGGGQTTCVYPAPGPQPEICNGLDDNCNGIVDDGVPSSPCIPSNAPPGLVYGGTSQCRMGQTQCINGTTQCVGWIGPSSEVCDGVDNDCNGVVDDGIVGLNQPCGSSVGACKPGKTACVGGAITCTGGVNPSPEVCDGIDNDCNGLTDDGALQGAPPAGGNGCWDLPGTCCSYHDPKTNKTTTWCGPPGSTCQGLGSLASPPCAAGVLQCGGAAGWVCHNAKDPTAEKCDGIDNDCNGQIDDGALPSPIGNPCGSNVGTCTPGVNVCVNGQVVCNGVGPSPEVCDGLDNDCDGTADNNIPGMGAACPVPYDTTAYPGQRNHLPCHPGVTQCDSSAGMVVCVGGVGPSPEVCDGLDNDCDGTIDESGTAPDGINGSSDPGDPANTIGGACGNSMGVCMPGLWKCALGKFVCSGGVLPQPETCDCNDNDCDGVVDNQNDGGVPPLCGSGKDCVNSGSSCACAAPCENKEFPCPAGQTCMNVTINGVPSATKYCVPNPCPDCSKVTTKGAGGVVVCAPLGTAPDPTTCATPPECTCKGQNGCQNPCFGVTCQPGTVCTDYGANAGKCVADTCFEHPCDGCGKVCDNGTCKDNPCKSDSCTPDKECKPSPDFTTFTCVTPCGTTTCPSGKVCIDGACADTCTPDCPSGKTCDRTQSPPACVDDKCTSNPCMDASCCNPVTGSCGNCACEGVLCPTGDVCKNGQCLSMGTTSSTTATTSTTTGGGTGGGGGGIWGLATGGGGCSTSPGNLADARWALVALAIAIARARRRRRDEASRSSAKGEEVSR